jgi:hypothetical protein
VTISPRKRRPILKAPAFVKAMPSCAGMNKAAGLFMIDAPAPSPRDLAAALLALKTDKP